MDLKYLKDGRAVLLDREIEGGFLVCDVYHDRNNEIGDEEDCEGGLYANGPAYFVDIVFDRAPIGKYDERIEALRKEIREAEVKRAGLLDEIREGEKEHARLLLKLKQIPALRHIEAAMNGEKLWFFDGEYGGFGIYNSDDERDDDKKPRMLMLLRGRNADDVEWGIGRYHDNSGGYRKVHICLTYEEAQQRAQEHANYMIRTGEWKNRNYLKEIRRHGLTVDPVYIHRCNDYEVEQARNTVANKKAEVEKAEHELAELEASINHGGQS